MNVEVRDADAGDALAVAALFHDTILSVNVGDYSVVQVEAWAGQLDLRYAVTPRVTGYASAARGRHTPLLDFNELTLAPIIHAEETVWNFEPARK